MDEAALVAESRIDDCLSVRGDHLWIEGCDAVELAARFGTPIYVVSENQLRRNVRRLARAFSGQWPGPVRVLPSIKANHVLALRRILSTEGLGCDTFGPSELWAALACGVAPALISVNGTGKSADASSTRQWRQAAASPWMHRESSTSRWRPRASMGAGPSSGCGYDRASPAWSTFHPTSASKATPLLRSRAGTRPGSR